MNIIQLNHCYKARLKPWLKTQHKPFALVDVFEHLGINPESDGAMYATPSIIKALAELGYSQAGELITNRIRKITRDELIT